MKEEEEEKIYCKKASFQNENYAIKFIKKLKETSKRNKVPQSAYLCKHCLTWHITSLNDWNEDSVEVQQLKKKLAKAERQLVDATNRIKRLERDKAKHHTQVYDLNQTIEAYRKINLKKSNV